MREFKERRSGFPIGVFDSGNVGAQNLYLRLRVFEAMTNMILDFQLEQGGKRIEEMKKEEAGGISQRERGGILSVAEL